MWIRRRYDDPTCIQYFFYFTDELEKLVEDYNALMSALSRPSLNKDELQKHLAEIRESKQQPYTILHCCPPLICLLHDVKDTLIWQVSYSKGKGFSDPKVVWSEAVQIPWNEIQYPYGRSTLFVVNVSARNLQQEFNRLYEVLRGIIPSLPSTPACGQAEGAIGYLRWVALDSFVLLVRKESGETESAEFQCATFPRLEMQRHKAHHYAYLASQSGKLIQQVLQTITSDSVWHTMYGLSDRHLNRLVEMSIEDINIMLNNIQVAQENFCRLRCEWIQGRFDGQVWEQIYNRMEVNQKETKHILEQVQRLCPRVTSPITPSLDERIYSLNSQVDEEIRKELQKMLDTLRKAQNPVGVLTQLSRTSLKLMDLLFATIGEEAPKGKSRPSDNLYDCIMRAHKGKDADPNFKHEGLRILPDEIASCLHTIRIYSNKADHDDERVKLTELDAENMLSLFLRVLEWFYYEYGLCCTNRLR
jgi:hypothetical protein